MHDGSDFGSSLLLYYELNPVNQRYDFRDADAEHDVATHMGIDMDIVSSGESKLEEVQRKVGGHRVDVQDA